MDDFIINPIYAAEVFRRTKERILIEENEEMRGVMKRVL